MAFGLAVGAAPNLRSRPADGAGNDPQGVWDEEDDEAHHPPTWTYGDVRRGARSGDGSWIGPDGPRVLVD